MKLKCICGRRILPVLLCLPMLLMGLTACRDETGEQTDSSTSEAPAGALVVPDSVPRDGKTDASAAIQKLIDDNPNRTIYFPDGQYRVDQPILTPADAAKSVSLVLSDFAVLKAGSSMKSGDAVVVLGGKDPYNNVTEVGTNYSFRGGVIDGNSVATGIAIESGRETIVSGVSIKNASCGIHIKYGANAGSSDADISDVTIVGTGTANSIGILVEGHDNTITNVRICKVQIGVKLTAGANMLRNVHPLYNSNFIKYDESCAFLDTWGDNWYDFCYSDQFCNAFRLGDGVRSFFTNCYCFWYSDQGSQHTAFFAEGKFNSVVNTFRAAFRDKTDNRMLREGSKAGTGEFNGVYINHEDKLSASDAYLAHLK